MDYIDQNLTLFLNGFHNEFFDGFFYLATQTLTWFPLFIALIWLIFKQQGPQGVVTLVFVAIIFLLTDRISSGLIKECVARPRPTHNEFLQYIIHTVNGYRGGQYGFVSSHAANCFGLATFFCLIVRRNSLNLALILWALINCWSRLYLGVHYVGDLICGALLGIVIAAIAYQIYLRAALHFFVINHHNKWTLKSGLSKMFGLNEPRIVALVLWVSIALLLIVSKFLLKWNC